MKLVEQLPQIDAQSTSMICGDVVPEIGDLYRLYLALNYIRKPIVTGRVPHRHLVDDEGDAVGGGRRRRRAGRTARSRSSTSARRRRCSGATSPART